MINNATSDLLTLGLILLGILLVASTVAPLLKLKAGGQSTPVIDNLRDRVNAWWIMAACVSLAFLMGQAGVIALFALCSFAAMREFMTLSNRRRADHVALAASFFIILPLQYFSIWKGWYGFYAIFIPVYAFLILPSISAIRSDTTNFLSRVSETQWGLMVSVFALSHVPALMSLNIPDYEGRQVLLIAFLIFVVQGSDVLQYVWGKLAGSHKIAPAVSPSKTWEGLIGGMACATLMGASLYWITPFSPLQAAGISLAITTMGFLGGLVMSAIKRDRGIKDWGHLIEGHGGFLDRLDSVIFAAPIFFHIIRFYWDVHPT